MNRGMFVSEQDIHNVAHNHASETYIKHAIDITSMRMWVAKNKLEVFYYYDVVELCLEELQGGSIPFRIGIQIEWQHEAMLKYGHESGVSIDVIFETNVKNVKLMLRNP